jgi:putative ABC transport system permease protein
VLPPTVLGRLRPTTVGLLLAGTALTPTQESDLSQVFGGTDPSAYLYVERGYQTPGAEKVVLWILFGLAGVLMLGGTLTATFLALSDARPDLATLSAVGAAPRTRRGVAAAYAVSVGVVGAVLGAAVGFIPGIAVSYPLTRSYTGVGPSHYLTIPWVEIVGLVLVLPALTALVVGLLARSRLPLVARLD